MSDGAGARLLALPPSVAIDRSVAALEDARAYFEPGGVWLPGPRREPRAVARARQVFDEPVVHPPLADAGGPVQRHDLGGVAIVTVQRGEVLPDAAATFSSALEAAGAATVVCDDVTVTVRPTALETTLEYGAELAAALAEGGTETETGDEGVDATVLTGGLPADYDRVWHLESTTGDPLGVDATPVAVESAFATDRDRTVVESLESAADPANDGSDTIEPASEDRVVSVRVHGTGPVESYGESGSLSLLSLSPDGSIGLETLDADAFGLEAVAGVGPTTAARLEERGLETRADLLEVSVDDLASIPGLGRTTAERIRRHATVLETGEPVRLTDDSPPGADWHTPPLCLDVETDGLSPTIPWLIGVYDPVSDEHRSFLERSDPTDPRPVLEAFCDWLLGVHPDRALLTWNGWGFDYRHLGAFVNRHLPAYAGEWESIPKFDCYLWAVKDEHAFLPGRTNRLEDVARALGYEGSDTGLDGATTAAAYQRFARTGQDLDWERFEAYCEDDCRALWHVYERLCEAPEATIGAGSSASADLHGQTGLGDF